MNINYKIILNYIKDISLEVPGADALIVSRENISKYLTDIQISSKVMKNNTMEIDTKMIYYDKTKNKKKSHFEIIYSTIIKLENLQKYLWLPKVLLKNLNNLKKYFDYLDFRQVLLSKPQQLLLMKLH